MTDGDASTRDRGWELQTGDVVERSPEFCLSVGGVESEPIQYEILNRLVDVDGGGRFYYVERDDGEDLLRGATPIEETYRPIDEDTDD